MLFASYIACSGNSTRINLITKTGWLPAVDIATS